MDDSVFTKQEATNSGGPIYPLHKPATEGTQTTVTDGEALRDAFDAAERARMNNAQGVNPEDADVYKMHEQAMMLGQLKKKKNRMEARAAVTRKKNRKKGKAARKAKKRNRK